MTHTHAWRTQIRGEKQMKGKTQTPKLKQHIKATISWLHQAGASKNKYACKAFHKH
jgi:hypothetical protein